MADVRVNGVREPLLQNVSELPILIQKLENMAVKGESALTSLTVNQVSIDMDNLTYHKLKLEAEDTVEARLDTAAQLSFESLQVALDMADLLLFDLKLATAHIWSGKKPYEKSLETLLSDCHLFLSLAARPLYLLHQDPRGLELEGQLCLEELDKIAINLENATLLAVHGKSKEACYVLAGDVKPAIEKWIGLSALFAKILNIKPAQTA